MKGKAPRVPTVVLVGDYQAGDTLREISARYGVSYQSLWWQLKHAGIELRPRSYRTQARADRACERCGAMYHPRYDGQRYCGRACLRGPQQATCKRGHPLTEENLSPRYGNSPRRCLECQRMKNREYYRQRRAATPPSDLGEQRQAARARRAGEGEAHGLE